MSLCFVTPRLHVLVVGGLRGSLTASLASLSSLGLLPDCHLVHGLEWTVHPCVVEVSLLLIGLPLLTLTTAFHID